MSKHRSVEYKKVYFKLERRTPKTAGRRTKTVAPAQLDQEFTLGPEATSAEEIVGALIPRPTLTAAPSRTEEIDGRFSLREMLLLMTLVAVGLAGMQWLPPRLYAGISGLAALVGLIILNVFKPTRMIAHLVWWSVLGIYALSCTLAAVSSY